MLHNVNDYINPPNSIICEDCHKETKDYIDHIPEIKQICPACAQKIMRRLLEDLIQYYNKDNTSKHYSLLEIMFHGEPDYVQE